MPKKIVQLNEEVIKVELKELVRNSVEETLNSLLEKEAQELTQAARQPMWCWESTWTAARIFWASGSVSMRVQNSGWGYCKTCKAVA